MARMFFPPGPINAPIFSGSILVRSNRGAKRLVSLRVVECKSTSCEEFQSVLHELAESTTNDLFANAIDLEVKLDTVIPFCVPAI